MGYRITIAAAARIKRAAHRTLAWEHSGSIPWEAKLAAASSSIDATGAFSGTQG